MRNIQTPVARSSDPRTSHDAADAITASGARAAQQQLTLTAVTAYPGRTTQELAQISGLSERMLSRRLSELADDGAIRRGQSRATRFLDGTQGRAGTTWLPPAAIQQQELPV